MAGERTPHNPRNDLKWTLGAVALLVLGTLAVAAAIVLLYNDQNNQVKPAQPTTTAVADVPVTEEAPTATPTPIYTATPYPTPPPPATIPPVDWTHPTADANIITQALAQPIAGNASTSQIERAVDPLTILPVRARSGIITYTVRSGDTLRSIAEQFGLEQNTIIWSNDRFYVNAMRIGMEMTIMPVNGVYHHVAAGETIESVAELYAVDPYAIIDSEYNPLFGTLPQTTLPEGLYVVVPGGTGSTEPIFWDPGIVIAAESSGSGGTGVQTGSVASFAIGDPGSCGEQVVSGGSPPFGAPIWDNYVISQDYSWNHGGIDLAVPVGTRVYAAGSGTVIFKGRSTWGYGHTVVIAHGSTLTIYGHLNGDFVSCGQVVSAGQNIAVSGNSGRSSGPHLHFEIRGAGGSPVNPWDYQGF